MRGRQISATGGFANYQRAARASRGGRSIVALPSTAAGGKASRIVAALGPGAIVTGARADIDCVATEHGLARLRDLTLDARAEALIAVAAPAFRADLGAAWREIRARL